MVLENMVPWGISGPKWDEVTREWRRLNNEELNDPYDSPNIIKVIKLRMREAVHLERMGERRGVYRVLVGKRKGKRLLWRPKLCGRIILRWRLKKWGRGNGQD
jgi:hypothetical protein